MTDDETEKLRALAERTQRDIARGDGMDESEQWTLARGCLALLDERDGLVANTAWALDRVAALVNERDNARAEVERLKQMLLWIEDEESALVVEAREAIEAAHAYDSHGAARSK